MPYDLDFIRPDEAVAGVALFDRPRVLDPDDLGWQLSDDIIPTPDDAPWTAACLPVPPSLLVAAVRRAADIVLSLILLVVTFPFLMFVALLIKASSKGPVLYRQERFGLNNVRFDLFKLRSMHTDAEVDGPRWTTLRDPRITRIGQLLRRSHLDELPQLINVLSGAMSIVGPRPERPHFVLQLARIIPDYGQRVTVKPGITGWAQVKLRYCASVEDARAKHALDLYYLERRTLMLDLFIMLATVRVMATFKGSR